MAERSAGLAAGLGTMIFFSGIFFTGTGLIIPNNVVAGAFIAIAAAYAAAVPDGGRLPGLLAPAVVFLLGLWVVASPFVFGISGPLFWSSIVLGGLVAVLAGTSAYGSWQLSRRRTAGV